MKKHSKHDRVSRIGRADHFISMDRTKLGTNNMEQPGRIRRNNNYISNMKGLCSFCTTNFPEEWSSKDLMEMFSRYGKVKDVMISDKRNNMWWRYAFARFHGVLAKHELEKSLDNVWIESYKLRANLSKYVEQVAKMAATIQKSSRV